jgi:hypothetical protein
MRTPKEGDLVKLVVEGLLSKNSVVKGIDSKLFLSTLEQVSITDIEVIKAFPAALPAKLYAQVLTEEGVLWTRGVLDDVHLELCEWFNDEGDFTRTEDLAEEIEKFKVISEGIGK